MTSILISLMMIPVFIGYFFATLFVLLFFLLALVASVLGVPIYFVNFVIRNLSRSAGVLIRDDGSPLIDLSIANPDFASQIVGAPHVFVRREIVRRLIEAQKLIPQGMHLRLDCGYNENLNVFDGSSPTEFAHHETGGAVDVKVVYLADNSDVDLGSMYNRSSIESAVASGVVADELTTTQQLGRDAMSEALIASGFVNNPSQWWHWSYGDVFWAKESKLSSFAIFGPIHA